jgi:hypothetical protein
MTSKMYFMKNKEQFLIEYLDNYFEKKDILKESDYHRFQELAESDETKNIISQSKKRTKEYKPST